MKSVALHNLGCKVNSYELDVISQKLQEKGYDIVPFDAKADIYIINTCTVTNIADRKSRQMLHQAKKRNPEAVVVATGCYTQTGTTNLEDDEYVDLIVGNQEKKDIVEIIEKYTGDKESFVTDLNKPCEYAEMTLEHTAEHTRAYIKIQDGCDQYCSYCIIPFARGHIRSRKEEDIVKEVEGLAKRGYREIILTGIHISSYGLDWEGKHNVQDGQHFDSAALLSLAKKLDAIPGVDRIRFGSLEPRIVTEEFAAGLQKLPSICPHFHLSLQSGCDATLKRMNRHYTTAEFKEGVDILRRTFEKPAITTDVITGFPGETEEEFAETTKFLGDINLYEMHVFPYSKRQGTVAEKMPGQLTQKEKKQRSDVLLEMTARQNQAFAEYFVGKDVEVLFEETKEIEGKTYLIGHSREYVPCCVELKASKQSESTSANHEMAYELVDGTKITSGEIRTGKGLRLLEGNVLCLALS